MYVANVKRRSNRRISWLASTRPSAATTVRPDAVVHPFTCTTSETERVGEWEGGMKRETPRGLDRHWQAVEAYPSNAIDTDSIRSTVDDMLSSLDLHHRSTRMIWTADAIELITLHSSCPPQNTRASKSSKTIDGQKYEWFFPLCPKIKEKIYYI